MESRRYAGDFSCDDCRKKRLTAASFSMSMATKKRRHPSASLRCLDCVASLAASERAQACSASECDNASPMTCSACEKSLPQSRFSGKQRRKDKPRCADCVTKAEEKEALEIAKVKDKKLEDAREVVQHLPAGASAAERLKALAAETAAEAESVTGLKPVKCLGGRRGRGGRSRGMRGFGSGSFGP